MKKILFFLLLLSSFTSFGQRKKWVGGNVVVSGVVPDTIRIAKGIKLDTVAGKVYIIIDTTWLRANYPTGSGSGGGGETPTAVIIIDPETLSSFSSVAGTAGDYQTVEVDGTDLNDDITVIAPTGFEVSTTGGVSWAGSAIAYSNLLPALARVRLKASNTAGSYSGSLTFSTPGATNKTISISGTSSEPEETPSEPDSAQWSMRLQDATITGTNVIYGDPNTGLSKTDSKTGWTLTTIAGQWQRHSSGNYATNDWAGDGTSSGYSTEFPLAKMNGNFIIDNHLTTTYLPNYPFRFTNLTAGTYKVRIMNSFLGSVTTSGPAEYHYKDAAGDHTIVMTGDQTNNKTEVLQFTVTITGTTIDFGPFQSASRTNFVAPASIRLIRQ